jgi:hypothetical protein
LPFSFVSALPPAHPPAPPGWVVVWASHLPSSVCVCSVPLAVSLVGAPHRQLCCVWK